MQPEFDGKIDIDLKIIKKREIKTSRKHETGEGGLSLDSRHPDANAEAGRGRRIQLQRFVLGEQKKGTILMGKKKTRDGEGA